MNRAGKLEAEGCVFAGNDDGLDVRAAPGSRLRSCLFGCAPRQKLMSSPRLRPYKRAVPGRQFFAPFASDEASRVVQ